MRAVAVLALVLATLASDSPAQPPTLPQEIEGLLHVVSVTGHEKPAVQYIRQRLDGLPTAEDMLGNLTVTLGSGQPRRLIACAVDERGYVISRIREDGYLRLSRVERSPHGTLWDQSHEGQAVVVVTERGLVPGAVGVKSIHLSHERVSPDLPFSVDHAYVDVGAATATEVHDLGIRLLDAVALMRRPVRLHGGLLAAPSARTKAACVAMIRAARHIAHAADNGTVVFAWTVLGHLGRRGLERVVRQHGPFEEAYLLSDGFGWQREDGTWAPTALPAPGSGVLVGGELPQGLALMTESPHAMLPAGLYTGAPKWGSAHLGYLALPAQYPETPVELVALTDIARLVDALVIAAGAEVAEQQPGPALSPPPPLLESQAGYEETTQVLADLISLYGVSGAEGSVRERIRALLPSWAQPRTDAKGNLLATFGSGSEHIVFVAHMDEVGFQVVSVREDGRLQVRPMGGLYASLWEAQAGLVHTANGTVPAVFEPRSNWYTAERRTPPDSMTVFGGANSRQEAEALGLRAGQTVTMPKRLLRLGRHRVLARSLDDRVGSTALLLAMRRIDAKALPRRVTFAWAVEEEIGLGGSRLLSAALLDVTQVYPVDTFVSSDAPLESPRFAFAPLGQGAVIRAMDSGNVVPRHMIDAIRALARADAIPLQYGMTRGWTDGTPFLANGVVNVPLSWPGRYSHAPVEVADLRDIEALIRLIVTVAIR